jgi:hypothetical protein
MSKCAFPNRLTGQGRRRHRAGAETLKLAEDKLARAKANMPTEDYRDARMRAEQAELDARLAEAQVLNQKSEEQLQLLSPASSVCASNWRCSQ